MSKLTDTQLIILSTASQRDDRGVELPANLQGEAARKVVDKLIRAGLLEEVRAPRGDERPPCSRPRRRNGCIQNQRLPQADFRSGTEVRS